MYIRQQHVAGERLFVDYSGKKPCIVNRFTGDVRDVELFVICWGYSQYTYAEAQESQELKNWVIAISTCCISCSPTLILQTENKRKIRSVFLQHFFQVEVL